MPLFSAKQPQYFLDRQPAWNLEFPKYTDWLTAVSEFFVDESQVTIDTITGIGLDVAVGDALDKLGEVVGIKRSQVELDSELLPDDDRYRKIIGGKIAQNNWDGSYEGFTNILNTVFLGSLVFSIVDNQNMTITIVVEGLSDAEDLELLVKGYYTPKPMGVGIIFALSESLDQEFSLEGTLSVQSIMNAFPQSSNPTVDGRILINGAFYSG